MNRRAQTPRRTVSLAITASDDTGRMLVVLRPPDDPDLPGIWGLPAGRVGPGETPEAAAARVGREKLGVAVEKLTYLRRGATERPGYDLEMELFQARIAAGEPAVPQPGEGVTQYSAWQWAEPAILEPAAARGSLCCRLLFESRANNPTERTTS